MCDPDDEIQDFLGYENQLKILVGYNFSNYKNYNRKILQYELSLELPKVNSPQQTIKYIKKHKQNGKPIF